MRADIAVTPVSQTIGDRLRRTARKPQFWFCLVALVPMIAWYLIFAVWSLARGVGLAFSTYHLLNPGLNKFVGFANFQHLFADPLFGLSLANSALWGVLGNFIGIPLCLGIAVCLV